jgi:hypothetical protein
LWRYGVENAASVRLSLPAAANRSHLVSLGHGGSIARARTGPRRRDGPAGAAALRAGGCRPAPGAGRTWRPGPRPPAAGAER